MQPGRLLLKFYHWWWRRRLASRQRAPPRRLDAGRWARAWEELPFRPAETLLAEVEAAWQEPHRAYHSIEHLEHGLALLAEYRHLAARPAELELAWYFHDLVYDPLRADNEEQSATKAKAALLGAGAAAALAERVGELILHTKHTAEPPDPDSRLLIDIDLAILGAEPERYDAYEQAIRDEYGFVPAGLFRKKRREILAAFLSRPRIYATPQLFERFEKNARQNLHRALS